MCGCVTGEMGGGQLGGAGRGEDALCEAAEAVDPMQSYLGVARRSSGILCAGEIAAAAECRAYEASCVCPLDSRVSRYRYMCVGARESAVELPSMRHFGGSGRLSGRGDAYGEPS